MGIGYPPGRREARKADRRRVILAAAERSFLDHGFAATSMSTIAAEVGGSKTTLWSYFPSKDALFAAVLDTKIQTFERELDEALLSTEGPRAVLTRFGRILLAKIMAPESVALHRLIVAEAPRFPSLGEAFATRGPDWVRARLRGWMADAMAAGRLRAGDPDIAARQFIALCQAGCYLDRLWRPAQRAGDRIDIDVGAAVEGFMHAWSPAAA